jgi:hypothetical protein
MKALVDSLPHDKSHNAVSREAFLKIIDDFHNGDMSRIYDVGQSPDAPAMGNLNGSGASYGSSGGDAPASAPAADEGASDGDAPDAESEDVGSAECVGAAASNNTAAHAAASTKGPDATHNTAAAPYDAKLDFELEQLREVAKAKRARDERRANEQDDEEREARKQKKINEVFEARDADVSAYINETDDTAAYLIALRLERRVRACYAADSTLKRPKRFSIKSYATLRKKKQQKMASSAAEVARNTAIPATVVPADEDGVFVMTNQDSTKYYVGKAVGNMAATIAAHVSGHIAIDDCRVHVPLLLSVGGKDRWEEETLAHMLVHGIANVKGDPILASKENAYQQLCEKHVLCFKCGREGHYSYVCTNPKFDAWTTGLRSCGKCGCRDHFAKSCHG